MCSKILKNWYPITFPYRNLVSCLIYIWLHVLHSQWTWVPYARLNLLDTTFTLLRHMVATFVLLNNLVVTFSLFSIWCPLLRYYINPSDCHLCVVRNLIGTFSLLTHEWHCWTFTMVQREECPNRSFCDINLDFLDIF